MSLRKTIKRFFKGHPRCDLEQQVATLRKEVDVYKAAVWYGNTVPLWANRDGVENWKAAREAYTGLVDVSVHEEFVKVGHIIHQGFFSTNLIQRLKTAFDEAVNNPEKAHNPFYHSEKLLKAYSDGPLPGPVPDCRRDLHNTERDLPMWQELVSDDFVSLVRNCLGSNFSVERVHAWKNSHCPPEFIKVFEPFSDRWHFDDQLSDTVFVFICLKEITLGDGPFHVHNITRSRELLRLGYDKSKRRESIGCGLNPEIYEDPPSTKFMGPPGSMIITMNSFCMHRAGCPEAGHSRDLMYIQLRPSKELRLTPNANKPCTMSST